jgi:hypothetical protein
MSTTGIYSGPAYGKVKLLWDKLMIWALTFLPFIALGNSKGSPSQAVIANHGSHIRFMLSRHSKDDRISARFSLPDTESPWWLSKDSRDMDAL